jgi:hypothetical protein
MSDRFSQQEPATAKPAFWYNPEIYKIIREWRDVL